MKSFRQVSGIIKNIAYHHMQTFWFVISSKLFCIFHTFWGWGWGRLGLGYRYQNLYTDTNQKYTDTYCGIGILFIKFKNINLKIENLKTITLD